jgi:hypothetical protein
LNGAVSGPFQVDQGTIGSQPVTDFTVQAETGYGGFQSNRNVLTLAWEQASVVGVDTLNYDTVVVTPGSPPVAAPGGAPGTVDFNPAGLSLPAVTVLDGGGAGGTAGSPILYFVRDARASAPTSVRAYQERPGVATPLELGSLTGPTGGTYHPSEALQIRALTTPRNADVVNHPDWAGRFHHVFITEYRHLDSAGSTALRHRVFDKDSMAVAGGDRFTPAADGATPPSTVDAGFDLSPIWLGTAQDADTVGLFFVQGDHLRYNEFSSATSGWMAAPATIDDRWPEPVLFPGILRPYLRDDPDDLHETVGFWGNNFGSATDRFFIRARY